jgi:serine/threonine protein kinase
LTAPAATPAIRDEQSFEPTSHPKSLPIGKTPQLQAPQHPWLREPNRPRINNEALLNGAVLASNGSRKVLRIGANVVVKFGPKVILAEAEAVMYIRNNTTIPVPKILDAYSKDGSNYIIMEYLDRDLLKEVWQHMPKAERSIIVSELRDYIC